MSLSYDPLGRLYEVSASGAVTRFQYNGSALIAETNGSGAVLRRHVHGPGVDAPIASFVGSTVAAGTMRLIHPDTRGSITAVTYDSGAAFQINSYGPYGTPEAGHVGRFGYTGQMWIPEAGVAHYKARAYSPALKRSLQPDPIGYADGMNRYGYVGGDPVNFTDPWGLEAKGRESILILGTPIKPRDQRKNVFETIGLFHNFSSRASAGFASYPASMGGGLSRSGGVTGGPSNGGAPGCTEGRECIQIWGRRGSNVVSTNFHLPGMSELLARPLYSGISWRNPALHQLLCPNQPRCSILVTRATLQKAMYGVHGSAKGVQRGIQTEKHFFRDELQNAPALNLIVSTLLNKSTSFAPSKNSPGSYHIWAPTPDFSMGAQIVDGMLYPSTGVQIRVGRAGDTRFDWQVNSITPTGQELPLWYYHD